MVVESAEFAGTKGGLFSLVQVADCEWVLSLGFGHLWFQYLFFLD